MVEQILANIQVYSNSDEYKNHFNRVIAGQNLVLSDQKGKYGLEFFTVHPKIEPNDFLRIAGRIKKSLDLDMITFVLMDVNFSKKSQDALSRGDWSNTDAYAIYNGLNTFGYDVGFAFRLNRLNPFDETSEDVTSKEAYYDVDLLPKGLIKFAENEDIHLLGSKNNVIILIESYYWRKTREKLSEKRI